MHQASAANGQSIVARIVSRRQMITAYMLRFMLCMCALVRLVAVRQLGDARVKNTRTWPFPAAMMAAVLEKHLTHEVSDSRLT